jgi:hypothetical protein
MDEEAPTEPGALGYVDHELLDQHHQNRDVSQPLKTYL